MSDVCKFDMRGQVVIVTGGAGLLGREYVKALAEANAGVIVADIDGARARPGAGEGAAELGVVEKVGGRRGRGG